MAVKNFPNVSPDANPSFTLESNTSSFESSLNKNVQHMELPGARWRGSVAFSNRTRQEANKIKAFMTSLGGQVGRFYLTPFDAYQSGTMSGAGVVNGAVTAGVSSLPTDGWEGDQDTLFEAGDYIEVNGELKMVTDDVAGSDYIEYAGTNYMPSPFDPSGWYGASDIDLSYTSVTETNPSGESFVGEFEYIGTSSATVIQTGYILPITAGNYAYFSIGFKEGVGIDSIRCFFQYSDGGTISDGSPTIKLSDGSGSLPSGWETKVTPLSNGYNLLQVRMMANTTNNYRNVIYLQSGNSIPSAGGKIKMQATYFGKSDRYKGAISYTGTNLMPSPFDPSGWSGASDGDLVYTSVTEPNPSGESFFGVFEQVGAGFGILSNSSASPVSVNVGEKIYLSIIAKNINSDSLLECYFDFSGNPDARARVRVSDGFNEWGVKNTFINFTELSDGYNLIQVEYVSTVSDTVSGRIVWFETGGVIPPIGSQLYVQAAYFGKADDYPAVIDPADPNQYPANLLATADVPIAPPLRKALTGGESIITNEPKGKFYLGSNDQNWDINVNGVQSMGFDFIEDVN